MALSYYQKSNESDARSGKCQGWWPRLKGHVPISNRRSRGSGNGYVFGRATSSEETTSGFPAQPGDAHGNKEREGPRHSDERRSEAAFVELCKNKAADDYVFASPKTDGRLKEVKKGFKTALRIAGIEGLRWHDLRATFGTRLGEAGYDAFTIAQLMGLGYSDDCSVCKRHRAQQTCCRRSRETWL